ncbi:hypothetical protein IPJ72_01025 [Candidatus Peregrinibacteria bacterium]|nr:MAG: hypothetical protein IPJ72_01025 [Candidatus Peregrinibacteria bacterium]
MTIKQSILKTLGFFDLFHYPLTAEEVMDYLYKNQKPIHIKEVKGILNELKTEEKVDQIHEYWFLKGRESNLETRKRNSLISKGLWQKVHHYAGYMVHIPFIRMIAVCNTLAYENANAESDIDLFIVVKPKRLWTARLLITGLLQFFGVRRHGAKVAGRFCLSFL